MIRIMNARKNGKTMMMKEYLKAKIKEHIENCNNLKVLQYLEAFIRLYIEKTQED